MTPEELSDKLVVFAVRAAETAASLSEDRVGAMVADSLMRAATEAGPSYDEGSASNRRSRFEDQLISAMKSLRQTRYWLRFIVQAELLVQSEVVPLIDECDELLSVLGTSLTTSKGSWHRERAMQIPNHVQFVVGNWVFSL